MKFKLTVITDAPQTDTAKALKELGTPYEHKSEPTEYGHLHIYTYLFENLYGAQQADLLATGALDDIGYQCHNATFECQGTWDLRLQ